MAELTPIDWALRPLKRYADFKGRAPRAEYWWFYLATVIVNAVLSFLDNLTSGESDALSGMFSLITLIPWIAVTIRRLHDTDRSGWWIASILLPLVALGLLASAGLLGTSFGTLSPAVWIAIFALLVVVITLFIFMVLPGTVGANRYGADPYRPDEQLEEIFA